MNHVPSPQRIFWCVVVVAVALAGSLLSPASAQPWRDDPVQILALSNRADVVSGGDVLVEVVLPDRADPSSVVMMAGERDVTDVFDVRDVRHEADGGTAGEQPAPDARGSGSGYDGRLTGLVEGLPIGVTRLTATLPDGSGAYLDVTNHPIGGPIFSGPQLQPWFCDTQEGGLGPAQDEQCNAAAVHNFYYRDVSTGEFAAYDPGNPPSDGAIATTTTDEDRTVPYIVQVESGTANRGIHSIAVLFDPAAPAAPLQAWNHKVHWVFGCGYSTDHRQGTQRACDVNTRGVRPGDDTVVLDHVALSRGFMVAASTQTHLGNNMNTTVNAETVMMVKEHIVERYGHIRYTMGQGDSGGAIGQHAIANQYPGLLDGLRPEKSFADPWSIATVNGAECPMLNNYFERISPALWPDPTQRNSVYGYQANVGSLPDVEQGIVFCHQPVGAFRPEIWDPDGGDPPYQESARPSPCVPAEQLYDPETNPEGVRCSPQDYIVNIVGRRAPSAWGPVEQEIGRGFANRFLDNVGLQYGFEALASGDISPDQFIDLNENIGGWDIDANWQPERTQADLPALERLYRSGQLVQGHGLAHVAIIDYRSDWNNDVHNNRQAAIVRERMLDANGHVDNRAEWIEPFGGLLSDPSNSELSFIVMDQWLSNIEADTSGDPLPVRIVRNRPAEATDGCFEEGARAEPEVCANYSLDLDPRLVAGMQESRDILKCQLKPLDRADYAVEFSDGQWERLVGAFPDGVCDWSKPGVGEQPNVTWQSYADGPDGVPLGDPPVSVPFGPEGPGPRVTRHDGPTRIETAVAVSGLGVDTADTVVIARADDFADALAGGPLAAHLEAPLLLTPRASLRSPTAAEITRLGATQAVLLGGEVALSAQVATDLTDLGLEVRRIEGPNRFATAAAIAAEMPAWGEALVTRGDAFADALAASGLGAAAGVPILLVEPARLPSETIAALTGDLDVTIVGGTAAVTQDVADQIHGIVSTVDRLAGATRYATSAAVADAALTRGISPAITWVATGSDFPDALVAAAGAGRDQAILLLIDGDDLDVSAETRGWLAANRVAITEIRIAGGQAAVSATVETGLRGI